MGCGYCGTTSDSTDSSLPSYFNYWGGNKVGTSGIADNCPFPRSYSNTYCEDSDMSTSYVSGNSGWIDYAIPKYYGKYSVCISHSLIDKGYNSISASHRCLKSTCSKDSNGNWQVTIGTNKAGTANDEILCTIADKG